MVGIYRIINIITNESYVGQSKNKSMVTGSTYKQYQIYNKNIMNRLID